MLFIILMFAAAFFIFTKLYRIALAWFVRARFDPRWESWAKIMTAAASLPLAAVSSIFAIDLLFALARLASKTILPIPSVVFYLNLFTEYKNWLLLLFSLLFLARMLPQTIAGSKLFAYNLEFRAEEAGLGSGDNFSR